MPGLERAERAAMALLAAGLIAGIAVVAWRQFHVRPVIRIDRSAGAGPIDGFERGRRPVNINHAGAGELERLSGIGKVIAGRIIEYRLQHGRFNSIEELKNVKGFGKALFEKVKDRVIVE